jgi:hypothetical protein
MSCAMSKLPEEALSMLLGPLLRESYIMLYHRVGATW